MISAQLKPASRVGTLSAIRALRVFVFLPVLEFVIGFQTVLELGNQSHANVSKLEDGPPFRRHTFNLLSPRRNLYRQPRIFNAAIKLQSDQHER
jgi:hypothetical protein